MNQRLSEWANIAEIIGAAAIIISLVYVSIQVRDNTNAIRSAATNDAATAMQSWYMSVGSDGQTSEVFYQGVTRPDSLIAEEMFQFTMITHAAFPGFQNGFELAERGTLDPEIRDSITNKLLATKDLPGYKIYWRQRGSQFNRRFRAFVEILNARPTNTSAEVYRVKKESPEQ